MAATKGMYYSNSEYGIAMTFPAGSRVCPALSGEHEHGFYAQYHGKAMSCDDMRSGRPGNSVSAISVYADYNADDESSQADFENYCKISDARPALSQAELHRLSIKGYAVRACSVKKPDGRIEVTVIAQNGKWSEDKQSRAAPYIFYTISLATNAAHLRHDLPMFEAFVHSVRIDQREPSH